MAVISAISESSDLILFFDVASVSFVARAVNSTVTVPEAPPASAFTIAVPGIDALTNVAVAFPFEVAAVSVMAPRDVVNEITVPSGTLFPAVSFAVAVTLVVETPSALMLSDEDTTVTVAQELV